MTFNSIVLFLHIVGSLGFFATLGLEWLSLFSLRRVSTVEPTREWLRVFGWLRWAGPTSMGIILFPGFHLMGVWGRPVWTVIALVAMVLLVGLGVLNGRWVAAIGRAVAAESGALSPTFRQRLRDPLLWVSIQMRVAITLGIVFLMATKPGLPGSLLTIGVAIILGLASAWPLWFPGRPHYKESKNEIGP